MQKTILCFASITIFCSNHAMDKKSLWVQTTDKKKWLVDAGTIASSNLLIFLQEKYKGSHINPLIIPLNSELLKLYWCYNAVPAQKLHDVLPSDKYFQLIGAAEKLKALKTYLHLVTEILPREDENKISYNTLHGHITQKWIGHLLIGSAIKNKHDSYTFPVKKLHNIRTQCLNIINRNGTYVIHNFCNESEKPEIKLYNIETKENECLHQSKEEQQVYLSPDNKYILIVDQYQGIYLYDIPTKQKNFLYEPYNQETDISISNDSKHILMRQLLPFKDYRIKYKLWHVNDDMIPQEVNSDNNCLSASKLAIFHPDNKHIFHLKEGKIYLYDIVKKTDKELNPHNIRNPIKKNYIFHDYLALSLDKKHIVSKIKNPRNTSLSDHFNYVVLDIQNTENIPCTLLPPSYKDYLSPLCIPHQDLIAYCSENKTLLQLLNKKQRLIASYARKENWISALASDKNGDYLACGYLDGLIVLWNVSDPQNRISNKKLVSLNVPIRHITFTDNQLLFAHSKSLLLTPTKNPGQAILWDAQGNHIIDFGNSIYDAHINQNGTCITVIKTDMQSRNSVKNLTLTCYNLNPQLPGLTLKQAYNLWQESRK